MRKLTLFALLLLLSIHVGGACVLAQNGSITRQETLRGSVTPEREWWDLLHYHLKVEFLPETRRLRGSNVVTFKTLKPDRKSTRLNSSHLVISYAVFCLKKKNKR